MRRLSVLLLALGVILTLSGCAGYRLECKDGECKSSTVPRASSRQAISEPPPDKSLRPLCAPAAAKADCTKKGNCGRETAVDALCSTDAMKTLLREGLGIADADDERYRQAMARDRDLIEQYPPDRARVFVSETLRRYQARKDKRAVADLQQEVDALRDYAVRKLGARDPDTLAVMHLAAVVQRDSGAFGTAEPLFVQTLKLREQVLGADAPAVAETAAELGTLYRTTGAYADARRRYEQALALRRRVLGPSHPDTAWSLNDLGALQLRQGDLAAAEPLLLAAKAVLVGRRNGWDVRAAEVMHNLGDLYRRTRRYAEADQAYTAMLVYYAVDTGGWGEDTRYATAVRDFAQLYLDGRGATKVSALEIETELFKTLHVFRETVGDDHPDTARTLALMAESAWRRGDREMARDRLAQALRIHEAATARELLYGSDERRRQYLATRTFDSEIGFALRDDQPAGRALGAEAVLQLKGRALDASADVLGRARSQLDERDRALVDALARVAGERSALRLAVLAQPDTDASRRRLASLAREQERLEAAVSLRDAALRRSLEPVSLAAVQRALGPREVLVEWARFRPRARSAADGLGPERYAAFVIGAQAAVEVLDLGPAAEIDALIGPWQPALRDPGRDAASDEARQLHRRVMAPVLERLGRLPAPPERLLLSPDGALNLVPFAALVDEQGRTLVDRVELAYVTSGRDLLRMNGAPAAGPRDGVTVVAAPDYGSAAGAGGGLYFAALPGTDQEAQLLRRLFALDAAHVLTGSAASAARVKQLRGPRILHVATHGFFLQTRRAADPARMAGARGVEEGESEATPSPGGAASPAAESPRAASGRTPVEDALLRAGLAFAGANARGGGGSDDGILTAAEMARLDLGGTQLVVLSACETGAGDLDSREGVYGLRRAIELAGAESQLVSLWKVNDAATARLMGLYYERLKAGEGRAQALRSAQRALRENPATAHPYYWAAFVPIGDWRPLGSD